MKTPHENSSAGNVLVLALVTILILSAVGATVLGNLTTRYNVVNSQVRGWKQSLHAAEAVGDVAYAEVRKSVMNPTGAFTGWTKQGSVYVSPETTIDDGLTGRARVDVFHYDPVTGNPWYRIRAAGTAALRGLKRVGMDDRMGPTTRGDSLLRKIDFNYDHFIANYGPNGDGVGKELVPVAQPKLTRRIELIASPITPFEAAIKCQGTFYGLGNAAMIDSYDSSKTPYYFAANNPNDPAFPDSRSGHVQISSAVAEVRGTIYGNLATNGGTVVRSNYVTGTVDNDVPFTLPVFRMPPMPVPQLSPTAVNGTTNLTPPAAGTPSHPTFYLFSSFDSNGKLTIYPFGNSQTYVAIRVTSNIAGSITIKPGVRAQFFFDGNLTMKARDMTNESGVPGNLQFYGISPANPNVVQQISIDSPGDFAAVIYAPSARYHMNGNPDITGALVCSTFYGNGNTSWHYDRALDHLGLPVDYRITSYIEDVR
jgi:hypothetical protein